MHRTTLVLAVFCVIASSAGAIDLIVDSTLDEIDAAPGDGACVSTPSGACTVRAAVMEANASAGLDVIIVPPGTFTLTIGGTGEDVAATGDLDLRDSVAIYGAGADLTVIDAGQIDRVFEVVTSDAYLDSLTIFNGSAVTAAGYLGGGVYHRGGALTLLAVKVAGNQANQGGGLFVSNSSSAVVSSCTFDHNMVLDLGITNQYGSAIYSEGDLELSFSSVTANSNEVGNFAAVYLHSCSPGVADVLNTTIADNAGGGLLAYNCDLGLRSTTIALNGSTGLAYGVYTGLTMQLVSTNSIIADNAGDDCFLTTANVGFASCLDSDDTCGMDVAGGNLPAIDPVLLSLRNWGGNTATVYPRPGLSPVIDAGAAVGSCPSVDQRNFPRPFDGDGDGVAVCDIGAVEIGDLILWAGFESGTLDEWTSSLP